MEVIEKKVDEVLGKIKILLPPDISSSQNQVDRIVRKLDIIEAGLNVKTVVNELETITKKLGEVYITEIDKTEQPSTNQFDLKGVRREDDSGSKKLIDWYSRDNKCSRKCPDNPGGLLVPEYEYGHWFLDLLGKKVQN